MRFSTQFMHYVEFMKRSWWNFICVVGLYLSLVMGLFKVKFKITAGLVMLDFAVWSLYGSYLIHKWRYD